MRQQFKSVKLWPMTHEALQALSALKQQSIAQVAEDLANVALGRAQAAQARKLKRGAK